MQHKFFLLIGICLSFSLSLASQPVVNRSDETKTQKNPGETYAIVVGISTYHYIRPLNYADKDAELFADVLRSGAGGNIKEENLFLLKNDSANAGNFWSALSRINNKGLKAGDRVYIYFAGHGDGVKGLNEYYLLLSDCQPANDGNNYLLSFSAIDMYRLKNRIGLLTAKGVEVLLILDACRTNELAGGYASQVFNSSIIQTPVGEIAMLATGPGQVSIEDASLRPGHGLFTYNLVDALSGRADKEEGDHNKSTSLEELNRWVSKNVKQMSEKFRVTQVPVFCCEDKYPTTIGRVDSSFSLAWNQLKEQQVTNTVASVKIQRNNDGMDDTALLALYNQFNAARKENRLWGEHSADTYYELMRNRFQKERITEDARYTLAADFINFAQQKINLYLEGKDLLSVEILKEKADSSGAPDFLEDEYERMKKSLSEKWTVTAMMIQKAGRLLSSNNDSSLLLQLKPKINFLMARGYLSREKENNLNFYQALQCAQDAWNEDSTAAYTAECLALMYTYKKSLDYRIRHLQLNEEDFPGIAYFGTRLRSDTAFYYYNKAVELAPRWVSPYRSIALKLYGYNSLDTAKMYMRKAISLSPADGSNYMLMGDLIGGSKPDSIIFYYKRALVFTPKAAHAEIYRKIGGTFMNYSTGKWYEIKTDSALAYYRKALDADPGNARVYTSMAYAFTHVNKPDSVLLYARAAIRVAPASQFPYQLALAVYSNRNQPDSVHYYSQKLLQADTASGYAASAIARYFDSKKMSDTAIKYYKRSLALKYDQDYCRERLGFLIMDKDKNDPAPLAYFNETVQESPFAWRSYFNIACYYANISNREKSIEFLENALQKGMKVKQPILSSVYLSFIREGESFKKLMAKYFPE